MTIGLADFLGRLEEVELRAAMAQGRIVHHPAACTLAPDALLDFAALDQLVRRMPRPADHLRVVTNRRTVDPKTVRVFDANQQLRPLALRDLLRQGAGLVVDKVHHHAPALWDLTLDAERRLGDRIWMAAVASYSTEAGLPLHYDRSDVIVLQVEGSKTWHFRGTPIIGCAASKQPEPEAPADITMTVTMRPGDVLFVPQGQYHVCHAEGRSLHLSLLVNHLNLADYVGDRLRAIAAINMPVRPYLGAEAMAAQQALLRSALADLAAEADLAAWVAARNAELARVGADAGAMLDPDTPGATACFATTLRPALRPDGMIAAAGAAVHATPALLAMVDALAMEPQPVAQLVERAAADVGEDAARDALRQLAKIGLVTVGN